MKLAAKIDFNSGFNRLWLVFNRRLRLLVNANLLQCSLQDFINPVAESDTKIDKSERLLVSQLVHVSLKDLFFFWSRWPQHKVRNAKSVYNFLL